MKDISRRKFLKGAAAASMLGLTAVNLGFPAFAAKEEEEKEAEKETKEEKEEEKKADEKEGAKEEASDIKWDGEYDVVVMGMGFAGTVSAITAAENGAKVLLVDKAPKGATGGNSKVSGQAIQATDDGEAMYTYLRQLIGDYPNFDDDVLHAYVDGTVDQYQWLVETMGADPDILCPEEFWDFQHRANFHTEPTKGFKGGKAGYAQNWDEFPDYEGHDHCFVLFVSGQEADSAFYQMCLDNVDKRSDNIEVWYQAPGKHLCTNEKGEVIGCQIVKDGKLLNIKANGGVILAVGGFEANKDMIATYMQRPNVYCRAAVYNEGDGVHMAQEVGADLWHMSNGAAFSWGYQPEGNKTCSSPSGITNGILVGPGGTRFMNEAAESRHGRIDIGGSWIMMPTPNPTWFIIDADQIENKMASTFSDKNEKEIEDGTIISADTIKELAEKINVPAEKLEKTIEKYNKAFDDEEDADYGRPFDTMKPIKKGPFYALKIGPTMLNTQGGPRRNKFAQIVKPGGSPIQGLFSAGELGALWPDMYNGGGNIGECCVFGRIAGENAAKRAKGDFEGAPDVEEVIEKATEEAPSYEGTHYVDGEYTGVGKGYGGEIKVTATVKDGKFVDIECEHSETESIGGAALPELVEQAKEGKTAWVDAVAGASVTTKGFEEAMTQIIAKASWN